MATRGKSARTAGHAYERQIAKELRDAGFEYCATSRYASREKDDQCVDLVHTEPFNFQLKRWKSAPNLHKELKKMPKDKNYNVVFHKRPNQGEIVAMSKESFYELLQMLKKEWII